MQTLVDRHFAGRIWPRAERKLRQHLPDCADCQRRYQQHMLLAELDPAALSTETRIAVGLGLDCQRTWTAPAALVPALGMAALAILFGVAVWTQGRQPPAGPPTGAPGFTARGAAPTPTKRASLLIYRVPRGGKAQRVLDSIAADDELAFAYRNPNGKRHLMVVARDERGRIYWYHPAWSDEAANPLSIAVQASQEVIELTEAVRQPIRGESITIYGIFSDRALSVQQVEASLSTPDDPSDKDFGDTIVVKRVLRVSKPRFSAPEAGKALPSDHTNGPGGGRVGELNRLAGISKSAVKVCANVVLGATLTCVCAKPTEASVSKVTAARQPKRAVFALIVGVNKSVDGKLPRLHYADDDAVRYFELFRQIGAQTYLLSRLDKNTQRLHPQAAAEAHAPRGWALSKVARRLAGDVARARRRAVETILYVVYAGHGNVEKGQGYISLEDRRLTGAILTAEVIRRIGANQTHLIVDACNSFFLAFSRGPGGERRPLRGFSHASSLPPSVGLLFSTSSARESHEWAAFQSGVFSHTVRSGLLGAADADRDGRVTYREIGAFVQRAAAAIPNERFRSQVYARAPRGTSVLLDIRQGLSKHLNVDGARAGRYLLEDSRGVRLADFHNSAAQPLRLMRPGVGMLYLRRPGSDREYAIAPALATVRLASLTPSAPRTSTRGAAHHAFSLLFSLPFDRQVVDHYRLQPTIIATPRDRPPRKLSGWRSGLGWGALGLGVTAFGIGIGMSIQAIGTRNNATPFDSQDEVGDRNREISTLNTAAITLYSMSAVAAVTGLTALLWPRKSTRPTVSASASSDGGTLQVAGSF